MNHFLWMHPWDLEGWEPRELLDEIASAGIHEIRLALAYHGGRMLLPRNRRHLVYEQHDSAIYFQPSLGAYGVLQPESGPHRDVTSAFLETAARNQFPVRAWLVLCHNDSLGRRHPHLCIHNYRHEPYRYALCPAQPAVQQYILALIQDAAALTGITGLDLEALSFMGYEHYSLHNKRAIPADPRLNICHCSVCRGDGDRVAVISQLLEHIRQVTPLPIDLRYTDDAAFYGGKSHLPQSLLPGRVDSITRTWLGKPVPQTPAPAMPDSVPANTGFSFHPPDTTSIDALRARYAHAAASCAVGFYCYGLASEEHWSWLKQVARKATQ